MIETTTLFFSLPRLQTPAAPPAPAPGLTTTPTAPGTISETLGLGAGETLGAAAIGVLLGLGIGWLLRKLYKWLFDINCWTETCTLIEDTGGTAETVPNPTGGGTSVAQKVCEYLCDSPFGIKMDWLAEHIPGTPCPKKLVFRKCRYKGIVLVIWVEIDGMRKGLKKPD